MRRNCIAIMTFNIVWVPSAKPIKLDRQPLIIYFLNPNTAHIATANGADS